MTQKIGRYEIKDELGRGGMATVYRAHDPRFKRDVAVKVLPREFLHDPTFLARFEREAQTIASLEHAAIVPVYDFGEQGGQPYLVMRFMTGGTLAERLKDGPLSVAEAAEIMQRIGSALDEAHARGVIHRDLKPTNILFDHHDDAFLSDFGIAKLIEATATFTGSAIVGTPSYMSPEQVHGTESLDGRSDIYSLGVVLFEILAGWAPYQADTPIRLAMMHVLEPVPRILEVKPDLPPVCEAVIEQAMAKEREERYETAGDLAAALSEAVQMEPIAPEEAIEEAEPEMVPPAVHERPPTTLESVAAPPDMIEKVEPVEEGVPPAPDIKPKRAGGAGATIVAVVAVIMVVVALVVVGSSQARRSQEATAAAEAQATRRVERTATARAQDTATRQAQRTVTAAARAELTAAARAQATATVEALEAAAAARSDGWPGWPLALYDPFNANVSDWITGDESSERATGSQIITSGKYRWEATTDQGVVWWRTPDFRTVSDFYLTVEAERVSGPRETACYGVIFRETGEEYYLFRICDDQRYSFIVWYDGDWTYLNWGSTSAIRPSETNRLTVVAEGSHFDFYINGQYVSEASDNRLSSGKVGLAINLGAGAEGVFEFDNLELYEP